MIARGLAKEPGERYRSAGELISEARRALAASARGFGETIVDPALLRRAPVVELKDEKRLSWQVVAIAAAICAGLAAAAVETLTWTCLYHQPLPGVWTYTDSA